MIYYSTIIIKKIYWLELLFVFVHMGKKNNDNSNNNTNNFYDQQQQQQTDLPRQTDRHQHKQSPSFWLNIVERISNCLKI